MRTTRIFRYLALTLVLACLSAGAVNAQSGTCGANLTWTLSNGTLTIRGTGDMYNYETNTTNIFNTPPWHALHRISFTNAVIENGVTSIGNYAFWECANLTSITVPNSVTRIGSDAFDDCGSLTSITVPNGVTEIGNYAFYGCSSLISITVPNGVTNIGNGTFYGCSSLTSIIIPDNVTYIGQYAFRDCSGLTFITIPSGVTEINNYAFAGCERLTSVTIPNRVIRIGQYAFRGCSGLTSITIPNSVTSIYQSAFSGCTSLAQIHNRRAAPQTISASVFDNVNKQTCTLYVPVGSLSAYRNAAVWKDFTNIVEENSTGIETVSVHSPALYPNPVVNGQLTIENGQLNDVVQIYDISGRMVETVRAPSLHNGVQTINVSALPAGAYILKIGNYTGRFVKK